MMKKVLIFLIRTYQKLLSPATGAFPKMFGLERDTCAFYPSCSSYAIEVIEKKGALLGSLKAARRLARCHPWQKPQTDIVQ